MTRVAGAQRRLLVKHLSEAGDASSRPEGWLDDLEIAVLAALARRGGSATAAQLGEDEERLRTKLLMSPGKAYQATPNITSRVLVMMAADGLIVRGRPTGSWLSQRYQWSLVDTWVPDEPSDPVEPWVALTLALDSTPMGWVNRDWYLGSHASAVFDGTGNVGPLVWCDGRVVGSWAQHRDGEVVWRLLEDIGAEATAMVASEAGRIANWLGEVRVVPRFRMPTERQLTQRR